MRLLKFISVFLLTVLVVFGLVLGLNWKAFKIFLDNRESMLEGSELVENTSSLANLADFIEEYPQYVSVASKMMDYPDSTMLYQPDVPRVMGTSANFFILVAGAMELDAGSISGDEMISWDDISRYQLPDVEESVHSQSLDFAAERGWLQDEEISVSNALRLLAEYNSLALADYLWWKINPGTWDELQQELELVQTGLPLPYSGLYQAISIGLQQQSVQEITGRWQNANPEEWRDYVAGLSRVYRSKSEEREQVREYMSSERLGNTFMEERDAMILFPKTTAGEMLNVLEDLWNNEAVNENVSGMVKEWMRWPLESQPRTLQDFDDYGAIYDSRMGLLNGFDFGTSAYTGNTSVQAVFFDRLPIAFWFHMSANHMHQDFQQRLIIDPAVIERMQEIAE